MGSKPVFLQMMSSDQEIRVLKQNHWSNQTCRGCEHPSGTETSETLTADWPKVWLYDAVPLPSVTFRFQPPRWLLIIKPTKAPFPDVGLKTFTVPHSRQTLRAEVNSLVTLVEPQMPRSARVPPDSSAIPQLTHLNTRTLILAHLSF